MERNNKTLLIAVLIMLLALVSLNFNNISGRAGGSSDAIVRVTPASLSVPGNANLFVDTNGVTVDSTVQLYRASGERAGVTGNLCKGSSCKGVLRENFFIDSRITPGRYFIRITQIGGGLGRSFDSNMFTVR